MLGAVATDGRHLYIHSPSYGVVKLGTGAYNTVRGALVHQNSTYRIGDSRRSIAFASGKLLYTSPELSQPRAEPRQAKVAVINAETLQEEVVVVLPFAADPDNNVLMSDGQHFYLLARLITEKAGAGPNKDGANKETMDDRFVVEVFSVSATNTLARVRTVTLDRAPVNVGPGEKPADEPALSNSAYERGAAFVTGHQLCVNWGMSPGLGHEGSFKARAFSLVDGKHIASGHTNTESTGTPHIRQLPT